MSEIPAQEHSDYSQDRAEQAHFQPLPWEVHPGMVKEKGHLRLAGQAYCISLEIRLQGRSESHLLSEIRLYNQGLGSRSSRASSVCLCDLGQASEITRSSVLSSVKWVRGNFSLESIF